MIRVFPGEPHPEHVLVPLDYEPLEETEFIVPSPQWPIDLVPLIFVAALIGAAVAAFLHWIVGFHWYSSMSIGWIYGIIVEAGALRSSRLRKGTVN